jgi:hypothetical protein
MLTEDEKKQLESTIARLGLASITTSEIGAFPILAMDGKNIIPRFDKFVDVTQNLIAKYKELRRKEAMK